MGLLPWNGRMIKLDQLVFVVFEYVTCRIDLHLGAVVNRTDFGKKLFGLKPRYNFGLQELCNSLETRKDQLILYREDEPLLIQTELHLLNLPKRIQAICW